MSSDAFIARITGTVINPQTASAAAAADRKYPLLAGCSKQPVHFFVIFINCGFHRAHEERRQMLTAAAYAAVAVSRVPLQNLLRLLLLVSSGIQTPTPDSLFYSAPPPSPAHPEGKRIDKGPLCGPNKNIYKKVSYLQEWREVDETKIVVG